MNLILAFALACSTPEAPKPAPVTPPPAAPMPANMPANMPMPGNAPTAGSTPAGMPANMPGMAMPGDDKKEADEAANLPPTVIPDSYAGIITAMREKQASIKLLIDAGKLKEIHPIAQQLMDLATALPSKASALPAATKGTVALKALDLKEQSDTMHDKADDGDNAGTKAAFTAVSADIDALAAAGK